MRAFLIIFLVCTGELAFTRPALAWSRAWCYANNVTTGACAQYYPPPKLTLPQDPSQSQQQNQTQNQQQNQTTDNTNTNIVGQGLQYLPVAPLAGCDSGASLSVGGAVGHDSGLFRDTTTTLYAAATIPIGRRHCQPVFAPVPVAAPITNVYYVAPAAPPVTIEHTVTEYKPRPTCANIPASEIAADKARIGGVRSHGHWVRKPLRLRHSTYLDDVALATLTAACIPIAPLIDP